jgi:hypothetical protein
LILSFLGGLGKTLGIEMYLLEKYFDLSSYTKQAFSLARANLKPEAFKELNEVLISTVYEEDYKTFKDRLFLAVDGFFLTLPNSKEVFDKYGKPSDVAYHPTASCSSIYDVLNDVILSSNMMPFGTSERQLAKENLDTIKRLLPEKKILLIGDRGYPGIGFFFELLSRDTDFIIRIQSNHYKEFTDQMRGELIDYTKIFKVNKSRQNDLKVYADLFEKIGYEIKLRVVKIEIGKNEYEYLITNLLDTTEFPHSDFKEIYNQRWSIETLFKRKKVLNELENFASKTNIRIEQEFYAKIYMMNLAQLIMNEADEEIAEENKEKGIENRHKVNRNIAYGVLKIEILNLLFKVSDVETELEKIKKAIKRHRIKIIKGRKFERKKLRRNLIYHWNQRRNS